MGTPALLIVDDDHAVLEALERDLKRRFGADYEVIAAGSPAVALDQIASIKDRGGEVALILTAQWTPGMTGVELLREAQGSFSSAQRGVLVTYGDWSTVGPLHEAATLGQIDFFLFKPWAAPDEWLYPIIGEYLSRWTRLKGRRFEAFRIIGEQWATRSHELRDRLDRNAVPYGFYDHDSEEGRRILESHGLDASLPVVIFFTGHVMVDPSYEDLARAIGVATTPSAASYDVAIIGAGPAGLAAAVSAASEGLRTVVVEARSLGGQAGTSSLIRNYLGFPMGLRGDELTARAYQQALLFGADFVFAPPAASLQVRGDDRVVTLENGVQITASTVVVASGVEYRSIGVPSLEALAGSGVFYGAAVTEARAMRGQRVVVVGAGNSAGQAAVYLAKFATHVSILVRSDDLAKSMSDYLIQEIEATDNIEVLVQTEVAEAIGKERLEGLVLRHRVRGTEETIPAAAAFLMVGGEAHTDWLADAVRRDGHGYIVTGSDLIAEAASSVAWPLARPPHMLETSVPGVFAVGDVRSGSMKRVASAAGEGSVVISFVHSTLSEKGIAVGMHTPEPPPTAAHVAEAKSQSP